MGVRLIAVRHGKPDSEGYADETLRPLSDEGRDAQRNVTEILKEENLIPNQIFTSPLLRAWETAEVIQEVLGSPIEEEQALGYDFDETRLISLIPPAELDQVIMMVGHEPTLAQFVNKLVGEEVLPQGLSKSAAAVVVFNDEVDFGEGELLTVFNP